MGPTTFFKNQFFSPGTREMEWNWHYTPRDISFDQAVDEFTHLFETLILNYTEGKKIILPLSGGLDSRTLAAALKGRKDVVVVSYEFENGIRETEYARQIAVTCGWEFHRVQWHQVDH